MVRQKNDTYLNVCIETSIYERLEVMCEDAGQSKTVAVERALTLYLDEYEEKQRKLRELETKAE
ncbi:MAG: ribbon-helix-helix protein, CopG family [Clostridia bacterium]|nr:ribbon-helix-helix protein, CopG family [Clostridia bacterium]MBQ5956168.1 ribbon-helix-helix protein, CopG family [Clostridia bacterium]MBQ6003313.1 ribbon-helix-helix protein, CopG family [Clostridia bacterium]